jgi:hypothetical protein
VNAHAITLLAWAVGLAAAAQFAVGSPVAWLCGALTLQLWYLLDHVDGQIARLRGTASLDGVQLDYLMHHTLNLLVPIGFGYGVARLAESDWFLGCGLAWGAAALVSGLLADTRYKSFVQRLKRVQGEMRVVGGGGARPAPQPGIPRGPRKLFGWLLQKACEPHVVMNCVTGLSLIAIALPARHGSLGTMFVAGMAIANCLVAGARLTRSVCREEVETEFSRWFQPPRDTSLTFRDGYWHVEPLHLPTTDAQER